METQPQHKSPKSDADVVVHINKQQFKLETPTQTGRALKELARIPLQDTLFRQRPHEDEVLANDAVVELKNGDHLYNQPPADYGKEVSLDELPVSLRRARVLPQPGGWTFVVFDYPVGDGYRPATVQLLVKLPPLFPDAAPDMFWVRPALVTATGAAPRGTTMESVLGESWQRFSWHLKPGSWRPGESDLRDYMRCVRARFERKD